MRKKPSPRTTTGQQASGTRITVTIPPQDYAAVRSLGLLSGTSSPPSFGLRRFPADQNDRFRNDAMLRKVIPELFL